MSYFEFPHTRTYDSDLGWIIRRLKVLLDDSESLLAWRTEHETEYETLKNQVEGIIGHLVDVIVPWDSSIAYQIYSIVEWQGTNYIAIKDVPVGAMITNTEYWTPANTVVEQINAIGLSVSGLIDDMADMETRLSELAELSWLAGQKVVVYGDSLAALPESYWQVLSEDSYGLDITNRAVSGLSTSGAAQRITDASDLASFDVIVVAIGTNDWLGSFPLDTTRSNMVTILTRCATAAPLARVVVITPYWSKGNFRSEDSSLNNHGYFISDYSQVIERAARDYGHSVIALEEIAGVNVHNYQALLIPSESDANIYVHQSATLGRKIASRILSLPLSDMREKDYSTHVNMLSVGDFPTATRITETSALSSIGAADRGGIMFTIAAGTSVTQTANRFIYFPSDMLYLSGYCGNGSTTTVQILNRDNAVVLEASITGSFRIPFDNRDGALSAGYVRLINNSPTSPAYVGNLAMYTESARQDWSGIYGLGTLLAGGTDMTWQSTDQTPHWRFRETMLILTGGYVTFASAHNPGDVLAADDNLKWCGKNNIPVPLTRAGYTTGNAVIALTPDGRMLAASKIEAAGYWIPGQVVQTR